MPDVLNLIDGALVEARDGGWRDSINPATGEPHTRCPDSSAADVDRAVSAAREAFPGWSSLPVAERSDALRRLADLIDEHRDDLARLETIDQGKVLSQAREIEIPRSAANFRFFAGAVEHAASSFHDMGGAGFNYTLRRPRGVVGCIAPWNLPLYLFTWKIAPALATGNTVVGKPSELTPATAGRLGELAIEAGLPRGVLNIVHGDGAVVGHRLVEHPEVGTITFTGGTSTGARIAETAGPLFKRISLELGGKNPVVVCEDADLDRAMPHIVRSAFSNQGQICLCGSRILVHRSRLEEFMEGFLPRVSALRTGDPLDPESDLGALVSREHLDKVQAYIELARSEGGKVACGGRRPPELPDRLDGGAFLEPTVLMGLPQSCRTNQEEIFGPVVSVQGFDSHGEAVRRANDVPYGLACSIWTDDLARAHRMSARIDAGIIWVNCWMVRDLRTPFGGWKQSGVGREGGEEALRFFTEATNVCIGFES
ncbi:MAG: aldehyde dehydrogenase [Planctomycetota bacterium]|nr:aldehyde dehydrogenase [Planctomycetota bacterium]